MLITLNIIKELENLGIQVKSMTEEFDTTTISGKFTITTLANLADYERTMCKYFYDKFFLYSSNLRIKCLILFLFITPNFSPSIDSIFISLDKI